ncbi:CotY/CotZ family spore coat protein [Mangrovibacillus sp. Mu-81]|uniref:CotY/CotZ family spore coat protein n=1 Tax=Mangrovibacillus sp. Mu-81 TaxID=3121478 RepID=UPI002FE4A94E
MERERAPQGHTCIQLALQELKKLQDFINETHTPYFGKVFSKLVGVDTIPFRLYTEEGELTFNGIDHHDPTGKSACFHTSYFRIEDLHMDSGCATFSLLRPLDICGCNPHSCSEILLLKKTDSCVQVDLRCVCAIQFMDIDLLKRKIIIEPKW